MPKLIATGHLEESKHLPTSIEGWSNYDVVILGDLEPDVFDVMQQQSLEEWVRKRGGSVVVIAGADYMPHGYRRGPLTDLLPVQEGPRHSVEREGYVPAFTPEGARHEALYAVRYASGECRFVGPTVSGGADLLPVFVLHT